MGNLDNIKSEKYPYYIYKNFRDLSNAIENISIQISKIILINLIPVLKFKHLKLMYNFYKFNIKHFTLKIYLYIA